VSIQSLNAVDSAKWFWLNKGGFHSSWVDFVDFALKSVDFVTVTGFCGFRFLGRPIITLIYVVQYLQQLKKS